MVFPYRPEEVEEAGRHFDEVVAAIQAASSRVHEAARGEAICKECDFPTYCCRRGHHRSG